MSNNYSTDVYKKGSQRLKKGLNDSCNTNIKTRKLLLTIDMSAQRKYALIEKKGEADTNEIQRSEIGKFTVEIK